MYCQIQYTVTVGAFSDKSWSPQLDSSMYCKILYKVTGRGFSDESCRALLESSMYCKIPYNLEESPPIWKDVLKVMVLISSRG